MMNYNSLFDEAIVSKFNISNNNNNDFLIQIEDVITEFTPDIDWDKLPKDKYLIELKNVKQVMVGQILVENLSSIAFEFNKKDTFYGEVLGFDLTKKSKLNIIIEWSDCSRRYDLIATILTHNFTYSYDFFFEEINIIKL